MSNKIEDLKPAVIEKAKSATEELRNNIIRFAITSTLRTAAEQIALFAQGRQPLSIVNEYRKRAGMRLIFPYTGKDGKQHSDNDYIVTWADGIINKSNHQGGMALDVVPVKANGNPEWPPLNDPRWRQIANVMIKYGFRWGGDWDGDGKTRSEGDLDETHADYPHYEILT